jgi:hypothetical protein
MRNPIHSHDAKSLEIGRCAVGAIAEVVADETPAVHGRISKSVWVNCDRTGQIGTDKRQNNRRDNEHKDANPRDFWRCGSTCVTA